MKRTPLLWLPLAACAAAQAIAAAPVEKASEAFFDAYCMDCHNDLDLKGSLDLGDLDYRPADPANFLTWVKVHDRLQAGEMPPKGKPRPEPAELRAYVSSLGSSLAGYEEGVAATQGRSVDRRLNRSEYENA